jgi:hypothetical protein
MVHHCVSTSSCRALDQGLAQSGSGQVSKHEHQDSSCSVTSEASNTHSEERLRTDVRVYYQQSRRLGFDRTDDSNEDVPERSRKYYETEDIYLDRRLRNLTRYGTLPDLATLFDNWNRGPSVDNFPDTSSFYYNVEEFPAMNACEADDYGNQPDYQGSRVFEGISDEAFVDDILNLERQIRSLPQPRHQSSHEDSLDLVPVDQDLALKPSECTILGRSDKIITFQAPLTSGETHSSLKARWKELRRKTKNEKKLPEKLSSQESREEDIVEQMEEVVVGLCSVSSMVSNGGIVRMQQDV